MSEKPPEKYQKVENKIEKTINPYVNIKVPMPEGVDKKAFLMLECDPDFIDLVQKQAKEWLTKEKSER
jgi:hypothetical protein